MDDLDPHIHIEDTDGGFVDSHLKRLTGEKEKKETKRMFKSELLNARDVSYLGPIFIGLPKS